MSGGLGFSGEVGRSRGPRGTKRTSAVPAAMYTASTRGSSSGFNRNNNNANYNRPGGGGNGAAPVPVRATPAARTQRAGRVAVRNMPGLPSNNTNAGSRTGGGGGGVNSMAQRRIVDSLTSASRQPPQQHENLAIHLQPVMDSVVASDGFDEDVGGGEDEYTLVDFPAASAPAPVRQRKATTTGTRTSSSSSGVADMSRILIDRATESVKQDLQLRLQSANTDLQHLLSQIASVRSNLPNIVRVNELSRDIAAAQTQRERERARLDALVEHVRTRTRESFGATAVVTAKQVPLYACHCGGGGGGDDATQSGYDDPAEFIETFIDNSATEAPQPQRYVKAGERVHVRLPAVRVQSSDGTLDTRWVCAQHIDTHTGDVSDYWMPVQGNGHFWINSINGTQDTADVVQYVTDFSL